MDRSPYPGAESSLREVFGSQVSLSELNGDVDENNSQPAEGYAGLGLNARPPSHSMHTRTPKSQPSKAITTTAKRRQTWLARAAKVAVLIGYSILHSRAVNFHLPKNVQTPSGAMPWIVDGILVATTAAAVPWSEGWKRKAPGLGQIMRGYGVLFGMLYAVSQLPSDALSYWILANPCMWYVVDGSVVGFIAATLLSFVGTAITYVGCPAAFSGSADGKIRTALTIATAYFGTSIIGGNLARKLF